MNNNKNETRSLLAIFPEEIWISILDLVDKPNDLINLMNASVLFSKLLQPRKVEYLFPNVVNILARNKYLTNKHSRHLLNFRLVSKTWRLGVNNILEDRSYNHGVFHFNNDHGSDAHSLNLEAEIAHPTYFDFLKSIKKRQLKQQIAPQLGSFLYETSSPFPSRHLEICQYKAIRDTQRPNPQEYSAFHHIAEKFLFRAGHHFWFVDITIGFQGLPLECYNQIGRFVQLMPNLKSLYISSHGFRVQDYSGLLDGPVFPVLENLKLLSLKSVTIPIMNLIIDSNKHIKTLIIPDMPHYTLFRSQEHPNGLVREDNLAQIRDLENLCISINFPRMFDRLPENWNLKILRLGFMDCLGLSLSRMFEKLECYQASLTELHIHLPITLTGRRTGDHLAFWEFSRNLRHNLPQLKRLELRIRNICCFDFLLNLVSLEYLSLYLRYDDFRPPKGATKERIIDVDYGLSDRFLECKIWDFIPNLQKVKLRFAVKKDRTRTYRRAELLWNKRRMELCI